MNKETIFVELAEESLIMESQALFGFFARIYTSEGIKMHGLSELTAETVKNKAMELGADLVGIGSVSRWKDVPES